MKDFFHQILKGSGSSASPAGPRLALAAFGKHPGWDDHIPGIGVESETLAVIKQKLYVGGIGSQIDSGAWEKLEPEKRLAGFDHTFLGFRGGHVLFGQLWSSTDRKGRSKYPMVLCLDAEGISADFILRELAPLMEKLRESCKAVTTAELVAAECRAAQERFRGLLNGGMNPAAISQTLEQRRRFLERPELGQDRIGLCRVLHELNSATGSGQAGRSRHFRVPMAATSRNEALLLWAAFFHSAIPNTAPLSLISRESTDWLDVIVGEPADTDFFCLQASLKALPLATQIPYELGPELKAHFAQVEDKFLTGRPVAPDKTVAPAILGIPAVKKGYSAASHPPKMGGKSRTTGVIVAVVVIVLVGIAAGFLLFGRKPAPPPVETTRPAAPTNATTVSSSSAVTGAVKTAVESPKPAPAPPPVTPGPSETDTAQYQAATNAAAKALARGDYQKAVDQAQIALNLRHQDAAATALASDAQQGLAFSKVAAEQQQKYAAAMQAGAQALKQTNYDEVIHQAGLALEIKPNDPAASQLTNDVRLAREHAAAWAELSKKFDAELSAATQALDAGNFTSATNHAALALALKPKEPQAMKLLASGNEALEKQAAADRKKRYDGAIQAAQGALQTKNNPEALRQADIALEIVHGDATATNLKTRAMEAIDLASAQANFDQADYDKAAQLCAKHFGVASFAQLTNNILAEQQALSEDGQKFSAGDYSFVKPLQGEACAHKAPFVELLNKATAEQSVLNDLQAWKETNGWQAVRLKLAEPASTGFIGKQPFHALNDWAKTQSDAAAQKQTVVRFDGQLESYLVSFNIWKTGDPRIKTADGRNAKRVDGGIGGQRDIYLLETTNMETAYRKAGLLSQDERQKNIELVRDAILRHD
jgi:hypothetical protein